MTAICPGRNVLTLSLQQQIDSFGTILYRHGNTETLCFLSTGLNYRNIEFALNHIH